jgi:uncharacterized Zn finger protein
MPIVPLSEAAVRSRASAQSFSRGEDYYRSGAVVSVEKRGNTLLAQVEGSSYEPYAVTIELQGTGVAEAACTCPYEGGGACKHIVAVLLTIIRRPDQVSERPAVTDLLAGLGQDDLRGLWVELLSEQPRLANWLEMRLATKVRPPAGATSSADQPRQRQTPIDAAPLRKQARYLMHASRDMGYEAAAGVTDQMSKMFEQARPFIEAGDGRNALLILEAVAEPYVDAWFEFDDSDGELGGLFEGLGSLFAEAILSADLSPEEREAWADKLTAWQGEVEEYGIDEGFDAAIAAAQQGWDYPPLQAVLQGHITDQGAWEDEAPWFADDLAVARLNVLERQGRTAEYLHLAEAEGQTALYLTMLVKAGRNREAVEYAQQYMSTTDEALALAQALHSHGQTADALKIAERGLGLQGTAIILARWLRDGAAASGRPDLALQAARAAFAQSFSLEDYQAAQAVAGREWPAVKAELLKQLGAASYAHDKIDIYLYEGMIDAAIQAVDTETYMGYYVLERVVDAAWQSHPEWAIRRCQSQAESIMDPGQSKYYHHAVRWLEKARQAYQAAGREGEWRSYLEDLIAKHARKHSLRPQLEALRK